MTTRRRAGRLLLLWAGLLVLLVAAGPVVRRVGAGITALRFLVEFLTDGASSWLSRATRPPELEPDPAGGTSAADGLDVWRPAGRGPWPTLLLAHGLTPDGRRDPRLLWTAERLARAGFLVAVPDLPGLRAQSLRPDDAIPVRRALQRLAAHPAARREPAVVLAVSVGLAPVALALAGPDGGLAASATGRPAIRLVLALGGYAEARELIRYFTTGAFSFGETAGRVRIDPALARAFLALNLDLIRDPGDRRAVAAELAGQPAPGPAGAEARAVLAVLANRDPARVDALLDALPSDTRALLDRLSPARHLAQAPARLLLVHGRDDPSIPFTESLRLGAAAPGRARVVLVGLVGHVEGQAPTLGRLVDFARLWSACYELLAG